MRQLFTFSLLETLLEQALKSNFFREICCERILGLSGKSKVISDNLLERWNRLIFLTSDMRSFLKSSDFNFVNQVRLIFMLN